MGDFAQLYQIKYGALALLVIQNTFLVVFMRYSRTVSGPMYASSTAVFTMEVVKFITCLGVIFYQNNGFYEFTDALKKEILQNPIEIIKLSVPSILYSVQNNLLYYALSHLDATTFQVGYQLKLLTTAVFSVLMLGKRLSKLQWISLLMLTAGVSLAQLSANQNAASASNTTAGFLAVLFAAVTSGFSGVYFERILKNSATTLWMRNVQMGISSIAGALLGIFISGDFPIVREHGFFFGYNSLVISVILLQAVGGLVVAVVVRYADNILKGFAASFSILTSLVLCYFFFDFHPTLQFLLGAVLVNFSMYLYSYQSKGKKTEGGGAGSVGVGGGGGGGDGSFNSNSKKFNVSVGNSHFLVSNEGEREKLLGEDKV